MKQCRKTKEWYFFKLSITSQDHDTDEETVFDEMTWKQWINNALKRSHGLFGEGIEYYIINQDNRILYLRVSYKDRDLFSQAISTYISTDELVGKPLIVSIVQETDNLDKLSITDDDKLWWNKLKDDINEDEECT